MAYLIFLLFFVAGVGFAVCFSVVFAPLLIALTGLVDALTHNRNMRNRLFEMGRSRGYIDASDLDYAVGYDAGFTAGSEAGRLGQQLELFDARFEKMA